MLLGPDLQSTHVKIQLFNLFYVMHNMKYCHKLLTVVCAGSEKVKIVSSDSRKCLHPWASSYVFRVAP